MNKNTAIKVQNLTKTYKLYDKPMDRLKESLHPLKKKYHKDFYALNDVSFEIKKGETVGIIGKNGSGKSTLLKIITGVLTPTSGRVNVNGKISAILELGAGFNPEMTGLENIYLNTSINGMNKQATNKIIDEIVDFAELGEHIHQPIKTYSSGMKARLAFAVSINVEPDILIVDEALSVGDISFQAKCFNKFKEFQKANKTILFVTHSLDLIVKHCGRAILINSGKKVYEGNVKDTTEMFRKIMVNLDPMKKNILIKQNNQDYSYKKLIKENPKSIIYGSLEAEIIDYAILNEELEVTTKLEHNENYTILISVRFNIDISDPIIAFTIKSFDGMEMTGTNTKYLDIDLGIVKSGEVVTIKFTQKMILNSKNYLLALGCTKFEKDGLKVFHRIYDAVAIQVVSTQKAVGMAFSNTEYEIIRKEIL